MNQKLPPTASVTSALDGAKLHSPSADRNADTLANLIAQHAPQTGAALEIASGTGQHVVHFASRLPGLTWQPTDVAPERLASIDAYINGTEVQNIRKARRLDATKAGWHGTVGPVDLIVLVNLLHLISTDRARIAVQEAVAALASGGRFVLYGPFRRQGVLISAGDARFDADLRGADQDIGYKNDSDVTEWLTGGGAATISQIEMPANNLAFVARKPG